MKLKSYMRGLGIGIVVTALIMGIATKDGRPLTDAEIRAAAAKLGMVDSESLRLTDLNQSGSKPDSGPEADSPSDSTPESAGEPTPDADAGLESGTTPESAPDPASGPEEGTAIGLPPDPASGPEEGTTPESAPDPASEPGAGATPEPTPDPVSTPEASAAPAPTAQASENASEEDTVKIVVQRGTGSRAVCNQLANAGLIADAAAFDQYLIDSGYSKRISAGTFEIPVGASDEEIAKIISKSR
ncbi:MAG: hypothetical protein NC517_08235 [Firmicutes bacterium]|nr:hypothetical protein [Bacillota bacterium]